MANTKRERIRSKNLIPSISTIDPEKITGRTEAIVTRNQKLPKTLPLSSGGVDSCKKVCEGTKIPTKESPIRTTAINDKTILIQ